MKKTSISFFLGFLVVVLLLVGCSDSDPTTSTTTTTTETPTTQQTDTQSKSGGILKYLSAYSPSAPFGWPLDTDWVRLYMINFVYAEPLVLYNSDGTVEPMLATEWELSSDYKSVTFTLREGVKFHDGTDFNADAVKFMLDSNIEAKNATSINWESAEIVSDYKVKLNLKTYNNAIWDDLRDTNCMIVSPTNVRDNGLEYAREHPVGTGPFVYENFERDVKAVFKKNPDYWQEGKPYLDGIEFVFVKDITTQQSLMQTGEGHVMTALGGRDLFDMENLGFDTFTYAAGVDVLEPDSVNAESVFADRNVRLAIDYAINRQQLCTAIGYGYMYPNNQIIPVPHPYFNSDIPMREYDPEKAKEILAEAGYPDGFQTTLLAQPMTESVALLVQEYLKAINIDAELQIMDNAAYWESSAKGWENALWVTSNSFSPNFAAGYRSVYPPYGNLHQSIKVPDGLAEVLDAAVTTPDPEEQLALNHQIAQIIYDDVMTICIDSSAMGYAVSPEIHDAQWLKGADWQYWNPATTWIEK